MTKARCSLRRWALILVYLLVVSAVVLAVLRLDVGSSLHLGDDRSDATASGITPNPPRHEDMTGREDPLQYLPPSVVRTWGRRDFLVVFGIPSVDITARRRRRYLQRSTCWRFPGVATKFNNFTGAMLVLYVFGRHPSHNFTYSAALKAEAAEWHDVIAIPMNEGRTTANKLIGSHSSWGNEAEVGMSRKTFLWFELALRLFPNASYIAKGDDDMFLRVPQYLADLRRLPRRKLYWGAFFSAKSRGASVSVWFRFALGPCYTLSRDVVESLISYKPLQRLAHLPYSSVRVPEYVLHGMGNEDVMVGFILTITRDRKLILAMESRCSFHDVHEGLRTSSVGSRSVMVHRLWESEYEELMLRFGSDVRVSPRRWKRISRHRIGVPCR